MALSPVNTGVSWRAWPLDNHFVVVGEHPVASAHAVTGHSCRERYPLGHRALLQVGEPTPRRPSRVGDRALDLREQTRVGIIEQRGWSRQLTWTSSARELFESQDLIGVRARGDPDKHQRPLERAGLGASPKRTRRCKSVSRCQAGSRPCRAADRAGRAVPKLGGRERA